MKARKSIKKLMSFFLFKYSFTLREENTTSIIVVEVIHFYSKSFTQFYPGSQIPYKKQQQQKLIKYF